LNMKTLSSEEARKSPYNLPNPQNCSYCNKLCKNLNSLKNHELRCKSNPNRRAFNNLGKYSHETRKGNNKFNNSEIAKCASSLKQRYDTDYISPLLGKKVSFEYFYKEHNNQEIDKWLSYIQGINIVLPTYETNITTEGYVIIRKFTSSCKIRANIISEHELVADTLLSGNLCKSNTVHHINKDRADNTPNNLLVFETTNDHKRFHNSKYAWLIYNDDTHKFSCVLKKV